MKDYYKILQITPDASIELIDASYRVLLDKYQPNKNIGFVKEAEARCAEIQEAYDVLSNPQKRTAYDAFYISQKQTSAPTEHHSFSNSNGINIKKNTSTHTIIFLIAVIIIIILCLFLCEKNKAFFEKKQDNVDSIPKSLATYGLEETDINLKEQERPFNHIEYEENHYEDPDYYNELYGDYPDNIYIKCPQQLTIQNDEGDKLIKIVDSRYNGTILSFYIRSHSTFTVNIPSGSYYLKCACGGEKWYGSDDLFGSMTTYIKSETSQYIGEYPYQYEYSITLEKTIDGNFHTESMSANDY